MRTYRNKLPLFTLTLALLFFGSPSFWKDTQAQTGLPQQKTYQFINGQWFDGKSFRRQTFYSVDGILTRKKPAKIDEVVDLKNGYVVPTRECTS